MNLPTNKKYTDGIEIPFEKTSTTPDGGPTGHIAAVTSLASLPLDQFTVRLSEWIDRREGSLQPVDDITVLAVEVTDG